MNEVRVIFDGDAQPLDQVVENVRSTLQSVATEFKNFGGSINIRKALVEPTKSAATEFKSIQTDITRYLVQEEKKRQQEVAGINRQTQSQASQQARFLTEITRRRVNQELTEERRLERERKRAASDVARSISGGSGAGSAIGSGLAGGLGVPLGAAAAITAVTGAAIVGGKAVLDYSSRLEQARIGFTTMTGSAVLAQQHLEELQKFAATTPFQFDQLVTASQQLQGVGFKAGEIIPLLKDVGNALSAAGRMEDLPFAIKALGDIQAKGKLAGQEIIQLANAGIPIRDVLAKSLGVSTSEVVKLGEEGKISADIVFKALHRMSSERFGDALSAQSKTFAGSLSNIYDSLSIVSSKAFAPYYEQIAKLANQTADAVSQQGDDLTNIGVTIGEKIAEGIGIGIGGLLANLPAILSKIAVKGVDSGFGVLPASQGAAKSFLQALGFDTKDFDDQAPKSMSDFFRKVGGGLFGKGPDFASQQGITTGTQNEQIITVWDPLTNTIKQIRQEVEQTPSLADKLDLSNAKDEAKQLKAEQTSLIKELDQGIRSATSLSQLKDIRSRAEAQIVDPEKAKDELLKVDAAIKESIDKGKEQVKTLGNTWRDAFENLALNADDNPFTKIFIEADSQLKKLRESIRGLPKDLQAVAIASQQAINFRQLFTEKTANTVRALNLRDEAANFRNPFDPDSAKAGEEKFIRDFLARNPNYQFLKQTEFQARQRDTRDPLSYNGMSYEDWIRRDILSRRDPRLVDDPKTRLNNRLEEIQGKLYQRGLTDEQRSIIDQQFISSTSGVNPLDLSAANRDAAAAAREREAAREEGRWKAAQEARMEQVRLLKKIAGEEKRLNDVAEREGKFGIDLRIRTDDSDTSVDVSRPGLSDTNRTFDLGFEGGTNR